MIKYSFVSPFLQILAGFSALESFDLLSVLGVCGVVSLGQSQGALRFPLEAPGENLFPCLFQLLEAPHFLAHGPFLCLPSQIWPLFHVASLCPSAAEKDFLLFKTHW